MILYQKDWDKYPNAIPDYETKNTSFLKMVGLYEELGVKNRYFPIALLHPELQGVDPFDPDLSPETVAKITLECIDNPFYFFREIVRVRNAGSIEPIRYQAHRGNIAMIWCFMNRIMTYSLWPRQFGKSLAAEGLDVYVGNIKGQSTTMHLYTKDDQLRRNIIARVKSLLDELPSYLKIRTRKDSNNTEDITWKALNNILYTSVAQESIKAARNIGRGLPIAYQRLEELAFCKNNHETVPPLLAAGNYARRSAELNGTPSGTIITTTAGFLNDPAGIYAKRIYDDCLPWTESFYDSEDIEDLKNIIRVNNNSRIQARGEDRRARIAILLEFNHRQLGKTDEELRRNIEEALSDGENRDADFFNIWGHGNIESPISKEDLKRIADSRYQNYYTSIDKNNYLTRWYVDKNQLENYLQNNYIVLGIDTSDAIGNDDISVIFRDVATAEVIGAAQYNEINTITFAGYIAKMLIDYPKMTLVPERKSSGMAIIDHIINILTQYNIDPFTRIFSWVVNDYNIVPEYKEFLTTPHKQRDIYKVNKLRKFFGYATTGSGQQSRNVLYNETFNASIRNTAHLVRDLPLISQLNGLIRKDGRIDHPKGEHDDAVIAWLLGYWFLAFAKNKHIYGIPNGLPLSSIIREKVKQEDPEVLERKLKEEKIKFRIAELKEKINQTTNDILKEQYSRRLAFLAEEIGMSEEEVLNIDDFKNQYKPNIDSDSMARMALNNILNKYRF